MDFLFKCYNILSVLEEEQLMHVITDERLWTQSQNIPGLGVFAYDDVLLMNRAGKPIRALKLTEHGERLVPGSTNTYFEQVIEDHGLKKEEFTLNFLEKLHAFRCTLRLQEMKQVSTQRPAWKFAENLESVIRARVSWRPSPNADMAIGWSRSTLFNCSLFQEDDLALASFVSAGDDPVQRAVLRKLKGVQILPDNHPLNSDFMKKLYRGLPCLDRSSTYRKVMEMMFVEEQSQTQRVMKAFKRFKVVLRCHGSDAEHVRTHVLEYRTSGLCSLNTPASHDGASDDPLETFKIAALLGFHACRTAVGETLISYTRVAVEMLLWCGVSCLKNNSSVQAMHFAQQALFLISCLSFHDDSKWLAIGVASVMEECYLKRNLKDAAETCQGVSHRIVAGMDRSLPMTDERIFFLRSAGLEKTVERRVFGKMEKWRVLLSEAVHEIDAPWIWSFEIPLFPQIFCLVEQIQLHTLRNEHSCVLADMMYTYSMKKWHALLLYVGTAFHTKKHMSKALDFFREASEASTKLGSINLKLHDLMYMADCMQNLGLTREACESYIKIITLTGGVEKVLDAEVFSTAPEWAVRVALGCSETCCILWEQGLVKKDIPAFASLKKVYSLLDRLQHWKPIPSEDFFLAGDLQTRIGKLHLELLEQKFRSSKFDAVHPMVNVLRVWKSNVKAMQLLEEESGIAAASGKKKKSKKQSSARTTSLEAGACKKVGKPEPVAVPDKPHEEGIEEKTHELVPTVAGGAQETRKGDDQHATDECCVCLDALKEFMFAPCGHRCACETCARDVMRTTKECPMCRAEASSIFKVFL